MSIIIAFGASPDLIWSKANRVYRQFLADIRATAPDNEKVLDAFQQAEYNNGLDLPIEAQYDAAFADELYRTIKKVAAARLRDQPSEPLAWREELDEAQQSQYLNSIRQLLAIAEKCGGTFFAFGRELTEGAPPEREMLKSMPGVLSLGDAPGEILSVFGWAFNRFFADLLATAPAGSELALALEQAKETRSLDLPRMAQARPELAKKLYATINRIGSATLQGSEDVRLSWKDGLNDVDQLQYVEFIKRLLGMHDRAAMHVGLPGR